MMIQKGRIIKNYNGYYYVETADKTLFTCKVKGKLKQERFSLVTGDFVEMETSGTEGMITQVLPRTNFLQRPLMANVDLVVIAFAYADPDLSFLMLDKLLALAESAGIQAIIVLNKEDLSNDALVKQCQEIYGKIGYEVYNTNATAGIGLAKLRERIKGKISVFAGPSGVGKSTLLNGLDHNLKLTTGQVSKKIGRGRHTTRFAQLLPFEGGYIADTPGFSNINLAELPIADLSGSFREFGPYAVQCKFTACTHSHEPGCGVKAAVAAGKIAASRYNSYLRMLSENAKSKERNLKK